jgi:hypothetical protein
MTTSASDARWDLGRSSRSIRYFTKTFALQTEAFPGLPGLENRDVLERTSKHRGSSSSNNLGRPVGLNHYSREICTCRMALTRQVGSLRCSEQCSSAKGGGEPQQATLVELEHIPRRVAFSHPILDTQSCSPKTLEHAPRPVTSVSYYPRYLFGSDQGKSLLG